MGWYTHEHLDIQAKLPIMGRVNTVNIVHNPVLTVVLPFRLCSPCCPIRRFTLLTVFVPVDCCGNQLFPW